MGIKRVIIEYDDDELPKGSQQWWDGIHSAPYAAPVPYDPCEHCMNNPKNNPHASGVCSCALPALYGIRY